MSVLMVIRIAFKALGRNKLRTALTMLGMIIGVGAVIAMVGIGNGAKAQIEAQIASMGQNVVLVWSGSMTRSGVHTGWGGAGTLTIDDAESIQRRMTALRSVDVPYTDAEITSAPAEVKGKTELDALVAYLQGLGLALK